MHTPVMHPLLFLYLQKAFHLKSPPPPHLLSIIKPPLKKQHLSGGAFTLIAHYELFDQATGANILQHFQREEPFFESDFFKSPPVQKAAWEDF